MKTIQATSKRGRRTVMVDDGDYSNVCGYLWNQRERGNVETADPEGQVSLPRWILGVGRGYVILHRDSNRLNCQRSNLICLALSDPRYRTFVNMAGTQGRELAMAQLLKMV